MAELWRGPKMVNDLPSVARKTRIAVLGHPMAAMKELRRRGVSGRRVEA